jgi:hypothetical protein
VRKHLTIEELGRWPTSAISSALPGFFTLGDYQVQVQDPLAQEYLSWLSDGKPTLE